MKIEFLGPVQPTGVHAQLAFVEILNIILLSRSITDVNRMLISNNMSQVYGSLSGHFKWSFANNHFTLWQRMEYNSDLCFRHRILDIHFSALVSRDKRQDTIITN